MIIKDKFGTRFNLRQAKSGKIIIPVGDKAITLSKEDAEIFCLYEIDDFDMELYQKAYDTEIAPNSH